MDLGKELRGRGAGLVPDRDRAPIRVEGQSEKSEQTD